ncbi:MAG: hypothetical protein JWQ62_169 [Lacunisphaera sp.]|nr:hypothetical protein [Lacunisphaera sp.]
MTEKSNESSRSLQPEATERSFGRRPKLSGATQRGSAEMAHGPGREPRNASAGVRIAGARRAAIRTSFGLRVGALLDGARGRRRATPLHTGGELARAGANSAGGSVSAPTGSEGTAGAETSLPGFRRSIPGVGKRRPYIDGARGRRRATPLHCKTHSPTGEHALRNRSLFIFQCSFVSGEDAESNEP